MARAGALAIVLAALAAPHHAAAATCNHYAATKGNDHGPGTATHPYRSVNRLVHSLHRYTGVVSLVTPTGCANVKLGSFGIACFVFDSPADTNQTAQGWQEPARLARRRTFCRPLLFWLKGRQAAFELPGYCRSVQSKVLSVGLEGAEHVHSRQHVEVLILQVSEVPGPDLRRLLDLLER